MFDTSFNAYSQCKYVSNLKAVDDPNIEAIQHEEYDSMSFAIYTIGSARAKSHIWDGTITQESL